MAKRQTALERAIAAVDVEIAAWQAARAKLAEQAQVENLKKRKQSFRPAKLVGEVK